MVIPAYNEEKRIGATLQAYGEYFDKKVSKNFDYEILVVINGTTDRTEDIVKKHQKIFKRIKYIDLVRNGKGYATTEGFKEALKSNCEFIGFVDSDMSTPPEAFHDLVENLKGCDGIIASRWKKGAIVTKRTLLRTIVSGAFNFLVRSLFLFRYSDTQCGAKLFKREVVKVIAPDLKLTKWAFDVNILYLCKINNFKIKDRATIWRDSDDSKISSIPKTAFQMFSGVVRLRLIYSPFAKILKPAKFILNIGEVIINKND